MRSALYGKSDYFLRIKRKPEQEKLLLLVQAGALTDIEIDKCGQPLWVREALREIKARGGLTQWQVVDQVVAEAEAAQIIARAQVYPVYQFKGIPHTLTPPKGFSLDVAVNDLILVDKPRNQVKIQYSLLTITHAMIDTLTDHSEFMGSFTDPGFIEFVAQNKQHS